MHSDLATYVDEVRAACDAGLEEGDLLEKVQSAAGRLVASDFHLTEEQRNIPSEGYGRNLLYRDLDHDFVVIAMVWPPGAGGAPHDHGTWGVVAVAEGTIRIVNYRANATDDPERFDLEEIVRIDGPVGATGYVKPPDEEIHAISNPATEGLSVSIHTYGKDIRRCRVFDAETGRVEEIELGYDNPIAD